MFELDVYHRFALEANVPRIKAQRYLEHCLQNGIELTPEGWFDLTIQAGGDRDLAEKRHNDAVVRAWQRQDAQGGGGLQI